MRGARTATTLIGALALNGCAGEFRFAQVNEAPEALISFPADGDTIGEGQLFEAVGLVTDNGHTAQELRVSWLVDDQEWCAGAPEPDGQTRCEMSIENGDHRITLEVTDPATALTSQRVVIRGVPTDAPTASLTAPALDAIYYADQDIRFAGQVSDTESPAEELVAEWEIDGEVRDDLDATVQPDGTVEALGRVPAGSDHVVKLVVRDPGGKVGSATIAPLAVQPPNTAPTCEITAPGDGAVFPLAQDVFLRGATADANIPTSAIAVAWSSDRDGALGQSTPSSAGNVALAVSGLSAGDHLMTMSATDEVGAACEDTVTVRIAEPPTAVIAGPQNGAVYREGEPIALEVDTSDAEDAPTALTVAWASDLDGPLGTTQPGIDGRATLPVDTLQSGNHVLSVTVTDTDGLATTQFVAVAVNAPPLAPGCTIEPAPLRTADDVDAVITEPAVDPNGQPVTYTYRWFRNDTLVPTEVQARVPSSRTTRGDRWRAEIRASDGLDTGPACAATATVANTAPQVHAANLGPGPFDTRFDIPCVVASSSDDDGDPISYTYRWFVNGSPASATSAALPRAAFVRGDEVACEVTPRDGREAGAPFTTAAVSVDNAPPAVSEPSVTPAGPQAFETLGCVYTFTDPDGDADASTVSWTVNGQPAGTGPTPTAAVTAGDVVRCTVTPHDGTVAGTPASALATIAASAPVVTNAAISPRPALRGSTLQCTWDYRDPQDEPDASTVRWRIGGSQVGTGPSLPPGAHVEGDLVTCEVTPSDGTFTGTPVTTSITVGNTPPGLASISVDPDPAFAGNDDLTCSVVVGGEAADPDGEAVSYVFTWRRNGNGFSGAVDDSFTSTVPAAAVFNGDTWRCEVRAFDGQDFGPAATDSVTAQRGLRPHLTAGDTYTCRVRSGGLTDCWGTGTGASPPAVGFYALAAGAQHTCGNALDGGIRCWGNIPAGAPSTLTWVDVWGGGQVACALSAANAWQCWGLGPNKPASGGLPFRQMDFSSSHGCGIRSDDTISCWGVNGGGQATPPPGRFAEVRTGDLYSCARSLGGALACWGVGASGPMRPPAGFDFTQLTAGGTHACAVREDHTVVCWGAPNPDRGQATVPSGLPPTLHVEAGPFHTCALAVDETVRCWGDNTQNQAPALR